MTLFLAEVREQAAGIIAKPVAQCFAGGAHLGYGFVSMHFHTGSPNSSSGVTTDGIGNPSRLFMLSIWRNLFGLAR